MPVTQTSSLDRSFQLADLICSAMNRPTFITLMEVGSNGWSFGAKGGWAGGIFSGPSRAPFFSIAKAAELLWFGDRGGLSITPVKELTEMNLGTGLLGGARLGQHIVGASKWQSQHDLLLALIILYSLEYEVRLHHIGWRMETENAMHEASKRELQAGFWGFPLPANDHQRMYHWHPETRSPNNGYYREFQFFPDGLQTPALHIDLAVGSPDNFLRFVAKAFGEEPKIWDEGPEKPYGVFWVRGDDDSIMGVMARECWTRLEPQK